MALIMKADKGLDLYVDWCDEILFVGTKFEIRHHLTRTLSWCYRPEEELALAEKLGSNDKVSGRGYWDDPRGLVLADDNRWLPRAKLAKFLITYQISGLEQARSLLETHPDDRT